MAQADGTKPDLRASDAERDEVANELGQHFQDGRLDQTEFDARVGAAMTAKTRRDLDSLLADLPQGSADQPDRGISEPGPAWLPGTGPSHPLLRRVTRGPWALCAVLPLLVAVAVFGGLFSGGWHHGWPFAPFGFLWLIVPILVAGGRARSGRRRQWR